MSIAGTLDQKQRRDPRIDPQPGDIVAVPWGNPADGVWEQRMVEDPLLPNGLSWRSDTWRHGVCQFKTWRRWAKSGKVVHRA